MKFNDFGLFLITNVLKKKKKERPILLEYNPENSMKKIPIVGWKLTISRKIIHGSLRANLGFL